MIAKSVVAVLALVAIVAADLSAVAYMTPVSTVSTSWSGTVSFWQAAGGGDVTVTVNVMTDAPDGEYGLHVHTWGDVSSASGAYVGPHYNPLNVTHGCPDSAAHHVGDLGNITVVSGVGTYNVNNGVISFLTLSGPQSIVGRGVVIHNVADDCTPTWTGAKAAQGVIGIMNMAGNTASIDSAGMPPTAIATIAATTNAVGVAAVPTLMGRVLFYETQNATVRMSMSLTGLVASTTYSWHIHQYGDLNSTAGAGIAAGGHYNPLASGFHGWPDMMVKHAGDLGNFTTDTNGNATVDVDYSQLRLWNVDTTSPSIVGRMVIIHALYDQGPYASTANGNAGARIGAGVIGLSSYAVNVNAYPIEQAVAWISTTAESYALGQMYNGSISFMRQGPSIVISGMITGFAPNSMHAIHVHQWGNVTTGAATGGHYNPLGVSHGCPNNATHHLGDMGNFLADANGVITISMTVAYMDLGGVSSIVGRAVVVHGAADDCQPGSSITYTGNSGPRLANGVIGVANVAGNTAHANPALGPLGTVSMPTGLMLQAVLMNTTAAPNLILGFANLFFDMTTYMNGTGMYVMSNIVGLAADSTHGWHIHSWGDITDRSATTAGGHYNPYLVGHDLPAGLPRHQGDLGNVTADANGVINVLAGPYNVAPLTFDKNVIGRTFMLHNVADIGAAGGPTGGAGARIACGVIGISGPVAGVTPPPPPPPPPMGTTTDASTTAASSASVVAAPFALIAVLIAALLL